MKRWWDEIQKLQLLIADSSWDRSLSPNELLPRSQRRPHDLLKDLTSKWVGSTMVTNPRVVSDCKMEMKIGLQWDVR